MLIRNWLNANLNEMEPVRIVATIEAQCNLKCLHCYWSHDMGFKSRSNWDEQIQKIKQMGLPLLYAGRMLTKAGPNFLRECVSQGVGFSIIDNGYTILNEPSFLPLYTGINISIDGWRDAHDKQRAKTGAFDRAWATILELKRQGFDPTVAAAYSPLSFEGWEKFEDLLATHDVPISSTLVWSLPETAKRSAGFMSDLLVVKAFEKLMGGIPKLINLYAPEHIKLLWPILKEFSWKEDHVDGDCLVTTLDNGTTILYRPPSVVSVGEVVLHWDGEFYTPPTYGEKVPLKDVGPQYFHRIHKLNQEELLLWKGGGSCQR